MKQEHKNIIEEIVREFQEQENGMFYINDYVKLFTDTNQRVTITRLLINDLELIDRVGSHSYRLNKNGWEFKSFGELDMLDEKRREKEQAELTNVITSTNLNRWFLKTKWLPLLLSFAAIVVSIYLNYQSTEKQKDMELQVRDMEKSIDTLRGEIMMLNKQLMIRQLK